MAGMNRLGSGPKKPGVVRPIDPNRFVAQELKPEGVEGDLEYQKLVKEVEDGIGGRQAGWLFGRGAFDKTDLQYLKDEEDKNKYTELEQTAQEKAKFARMRAQQEMQDTGGGPGSLVADLAEQARNKKKEQATMSKQSQLLARVVKVKKAGGGGGTGDKDEGAEQRNKRAKTGGDTDAREGPATAPNAPVDDEPPPSLPGLLGDYGSDSDEGDGDAQD